MSLDYAGAGVAPAVAISEFEPELLGPVSFGLHQSGFAMTVVAVYKFRATFRSTETTLHALPAEGLSREGLLLLRQDGDQRSDAIAIATCARHGAHDAVIERYSPIDPSVLGHPQNAHMVPLYKTALEAGNAMMYYPNSAPESETPVITSAGFRADDRRH